MNLEIDGKEYEVKFDWLAVKIWEEATGKNAFTTYLSPDYKKSATDALTFVWAAIHSAARAKAAECKLTVDEVGASLKFNSPVMLMLLREANSDLGDGVENPSQPKTMSQEEENPSHGTTSSESPSANSK